MCYPAGGKKTKPLVLEIFYGFLYVMDLNGKLNEFQHFPEGFYFGLLLNTSGNIMRLRYVNHQR